MPPSRNATQTSPRGGDARRLTVIGTRHDLRAWLVLAAVAVLLLTLVPMSPPASAQLPDLPLPLGDDDDGGGGADPEGDPGGQGPGGLPAVPLPGEEPAQGGVKTAYYTSPTSDALPNTLISEFPPGVVCILFPDACTEDANQLTGPLQEVLIGAVEQLDELTADAAQPVPPGALPVGILSGRERYSSALDVALPPVGEDQSFGELLITLQMTDHAFALESPAFRELVNAVLQQATDNSGPEPFQALLEGMAGGDVEPFTTDFPGLEMCVIKAPWDAGDSQPRSAQPEIDPLFCSPMAKPDDSGAVTFDMTFPANDSTPEGLVPGWEGVLVRPLGSANLAFGDADYTTNYIAYVENPATTPPAISSLVVDGPPPAPPVDTSTTDGGGSGGGGIGSSGSSGSTGSSGGGPGSAGGAAGGATSTGSPGTGGSTPAGDTIAGDLGDAVAGGEHAGDDALSTTPLLDAFPVDIASSAWIPWLLFPMVLGGAVWYGRVLDGAPADLVERAGAMTRLLRQRGFTV